MKLAISILTLGESTSVEDVLSESFVSAGVEGVRDGVWGLDNVAGLCGFELELSERSIVAESNSVYGESQQLGGRMSGSP